MAPKRELTALPGATRVAELGLHGSTLVLQPKSG